MHVPDKSEYVLKLVFVLHPNFKTPLTILYGPSMFIGTKCARHTGVWGTDNSIMACTLMIYDIARQTDSNKMYIT